MAWGTAPEYAAWLRNFVENAKVRHHFKAGKCFFCRRPFGDYDVPKQVLTSSGVNRDACSSCASAMGVRNRKQLASDRSKEAEKERKRKKKEEEVRDRER